MESIRASFTSDGALIHWVDPYLPLLFNLAYGFIILIVGWAVSKWLNRAVLVAFRKAHLDEALARFLASIAQYAVLAAVVIAALNRVGVQTTSLVALLASAGLAIGLALQGSLSSFASGVMILFFRPFNLGDYVELSGHHGIVDDIGIFQTKLAAFEGQTVILPNSTIMTNPITNFTSRGVRRATVTVGVKYGTDVARMLELLRTAAAKVPTGIADPAPLLQFAELGHSSLDFTIGLWCKAADFGATLTGLRTAVYEEVNAAGLEIPFQQIVIHQAEAA